MKEAIELFRLKSYRAAKGKFLENYAEDPVCASLHLYEISLALRETQEQKKYLNLHLNELAKQKKFSQYLEIHSRSLTESLYCEHWDFVLEALFFAGMIDEFEDLVKIFWQQRVESKKFKKANEFYALIRESRPLLIENYTGFIKVCALMGNRDELINAAYELIKILSAKKHRRKTLLSKREVYDDLLDVLEQVRSRCAEMDKLILKLQRERDIGNGTEWKAKTLLEYIILFKNEPAELKLIAEIKSEKFEQSIRQTLAKMKLIRPKGSKAKDESQGSEVEKIQAEVSQILHLKKVNEEPFRFFKGSSAIENKVEETETTEDEIISRIKSNDKKLLTHADETVHALINLRFYRGAYELLKKLSGPRYAYLRCWVILKLERYHELVDEAILSISEHQLENDQASAFNYFAGKGYLELGNKKNAQKYLMQVTKENPDFENVSELLSRAKS